MAEVLPENSSFRIFFLKILNFKKLAFDRFYKLKLRRMEEGRKYQVSSKFLN